MSEEVKFTGFFEAHKADGGDEMRTTIRYLTLDEVIERMRARLATARPGDHVHIDVLTWGDV